MSERAKQVLKYFEEQKDYLNVRVKSGIELYRKGSARIRVVDENGEPVRGAVIEAKEIKQTFKFGANTFMIDELDPPKKTRFIKRNFPNCLIWTSFPFVGCIWEDDFSD